jgi:type IV pilus assembly protein PilW
LPSNPLYPLLAAGQAITGTHNAAPPGDTLSVQYETALNDGVINCTGGTNTVAATLVYVNQFSADVLGNLKCQVNQVAAVNLISPTGATGSPKSGGVTNMQVLYGVKTNNAVVNNNADTYFTATQMTPTLWNSLICIKVTLTFDNSALFKSQPGQPPTINFTRVITVMSRGGVNT